MRCSNVRINRIGAAGAVLQAPEMKEVSEIGNAFYLLLSVTYCYYYYYYYYITVVIFHEIQMDDVLKLG
jgi:hypothetical protein